MLEERQSQTSSSTSGSAESSWPDRDASSLHHAHDQARFRLFFGPHVGEPASAVRPAIGPCAPAQRLAMLELLSPATHVAAPMIETWPRLPALVTHHSHLQDSHPQANAQVNAQLNGDDGTQVKLLAELSASIAHEICQPLLGIAANAAASLRWLQREAPNVEEAVAGLKDIRAGCERAARIVQALGALARQAPLQLQWIRIDDVIGQAIALTAAALARQGVALEMRLGADRLIFADPVQLQQLVFNLITNALEAMAGLDTGLGLLRITSLAVSDSVEVCIDDNGPGIAPAQRHQVFSSFFTTKSSGLGIGLAICRSVINAHKGSIRAESADTGGARIRFSLPVRSEMS